MPSTALRPSQKTDDIGMRLVVPSSLVELSSTTGVPKYRIAGSTTTWSVVAGCVGAVAAVLVMGTTLGGAAAAVRRESDAASPDNYS